jgi:hypothetical protein
MKRLAGSGDSSRRRRGFAGTRATENSTSYELTIRQEPEFLHAIVAGANSKQNVMRYLEEVQRECIARGCTRVLIEERLQGPRLDTLSVFQIAARGSSGVEHLFEAIAYVDANAEGDLMEFAETVAVNRELPVAVFGSVDNAREWLISYEAAGAFQVADRGSTPRQPRAS